MVAYKNGTIKFVPAVNLRLKVGRRRKKSRCKDILSPSQLSSLRQLTSTRMPSLTLMILNKPWLKNPQKDIVKRMFKECLKSLIENSAEVKLLTRILDSTSELHSQYMPMELPMSLNCQLTSDLEVSP